MKEYGIPTKQINLTQMTLSEGLNKVKIRNTLSGCFVTECGIRQGNSSCTLLFNIGLEKSTREIIIKTGGTILVD
jgi:hypothetical protein